MGDALPFRLTEVTHESADRNQLKPQRELERWCKYANKFEDFFSSLASWCDTLRSVCEHWSAWQGVADLSLVPPIRNKRVIFIGDKGIQCISTTHLQWGQRSSAKRDVFGLSALGRGTLCQSCRLPQLTQCLLADSGALPEKYCHYVCLWLEILLLTS